MISSIGNSNKYLTVLDINNQQASQRTWVTRNSDVARFEDLMKIQIMNMELTSKTSTSQQHKDPGVKSITMKDRGSVVDGNNSLNNEGSEISKSFVSDKQKVNNGKEVSSEY